MKYEESPTVELKATLLEEVKHEILAFLNAHGGTVYVGANDDGSLCIGSLKQPKRRKRQAQHNVDPMSRTH